MTSFITLVLSLFLFCPIFRNHFLVKSAAVTPSNALSYLRKFGHAPPPDPMRGNLMSQEALTDSIMSFQRFAGLPITGELDKETLQKMSDKRCGNPDIAGTENAKRKKRYALQGSNWPNKQLTYKILNYTPDMSPTQVNYEIEEAFKWWADQSKLTFKRVGGRRKADIEINFASGAHGDGDPFDGEGKTLAHAYFPTYGGDAHFDEDETWVLFMGGKPGTKLRIVAAHEFGHSLGLSHSDVYTALMAPFYNSDSVGLDIDDIQAIQRLYGKPYVKPANIPSTRYTTTTRKPAPTRTPRQTTTTTLTPPVGACNGRFDAMTRLNNGSTYAFLGDEFWRLNDNGQDEGYPQKISKAWRGIRGKIDAALTYKKYTYVFQKSQVYRYSGDRYQSGPLSISKVFSGIPSNIDAAFQWSGNGKLYFTKGNKYWRYNPSYRRTDNGYPKSLSVWRGLPSNIDASLQWRGQTYFFQQGKYYRFDDERIEVAKLTTYPYPRRADEWWLGCKDNTLRMPGDNKDLSKKSDTNNNSANNFNNSDDGGGGKGSKLSYTTHTLFFISTTTMVLLHSVMA